MNVKINTMQNTSEEEKIREEAIEELLMHMLPAITSIDGGCPSCVKEFVAKTNDLLKNLGYKTRIYFAKDSSSPFPEWPHPAKIENELGN